VLDGAPAQIVVGSATPEFIMSLYTNIFIWTVLAAIQFAAIFYIESFGLSAVAIQAWCRHKSALKQRCGWYVRLLPFTFDVRRLDRFHIFW